MKNFVSNLVSAGVGIPYSQEDVPMEDQKIYGHIHIVGLEGGDYHAFITELCPKTWIAFAYVSWQADEWGSVDLSEYEELPIMLEETFDGGSYTYSEMMKYLDNVKQE